MTGNITFVTARTWESLAIADALTTATSITAEVVERLDLSLIQRGWTRCVVLDPIAVHVAAGEECIRQVARRGVPMVALLKSNQVACAAHWYLSGVSVIHYDSTPADLRYGMSKVLDNRKYAPEVVTDYVIAAKESGIESLTPKEISCLTYIGKGLMMKEVAQLMHISPKTAETHRHNISRKLGNPTKAALVGLALDAGLVTMEQLRIAA